MTKVYSNLYSHPPLCVMQWAWPAVSVWSAVAGRAFPLIYSCLCETMQNAGPGLRLLFTMEPSPQADRSESSSKEDYTRSLAQGPTQSDKSINTGDLQNAQHCTATKLPHPPTAHRHVTLVTFTTVFADFTFLQQFVLETQVLDSGNLTLLMLWFCSHVLIKHNRKYAVLALMKRRGRCTEKRSSYSGLGLVCSFKLSLSAADLV